MHRELGDKLRLRVQLAEYHLFVVRSKPARLDTYPANFRLHQHAVIVTDMETNIGVTS